jgi:P27 family predicted phage terminase small subunit
MPNRRSKRPQGHREQKVVHLHPVVKAEIPKPPARLSKGSRELWDAFWKSDVAGAATATDHFALKRWIQSVDERNRLLVVVQKATTVRGSTGQPVLNPLAKRLDQLEGQIERFERQFGMTPKARADLGIAIAAMTAEQLNRLARNEPDQDLDPSSNEFDDFIDATAEDG